MAKVCIVCGDTGTGKSSSLKNLKPEETYVINVLNKPLPFKGSKALYNENNKNHVNTTSYQDILNILEAIDKKGTHIKNLILDDLGFVMTTEFFARANEKGFDKFAQFGLHMQQIISRAKDMRDDLNVVLMYHEDDDVSDRIKVGKKIKLIGQMLDDKYNPLGVVSVCLFTDVTFDDKSGEAKYGFITNRTQRNGLIIPAKSPQGMFEGNTIPNDLSIVFKAMDEYYN